MRAGTTTVEVYGGDRDRLNDLARELTAAGPGRFGQKEALRYLLDAHQAFTAITASGLGEMP